jgi:hypothetical protein
MDASSTPEASGKRRKLRSFGGWKTSTAHRAPGAPKRCARDDQASGEGGGVAAHDVPSTTTLYGRTGDDIILDEVERIAI